MGFYLFSNDKIKNFNTKLEQPVFIGIGNSDSLHALFFSSRKNDFKRIYFVDNNLTQLKYLQKMINLILKYENRELFLKDLLFIPKNQKVALENINVNQISSSYNCKANIEGGFLKIDFDQEVAGGFSSYYISIDSKEDRYNNLNLFSAGYGWKGYLKNNNSYIKFRKKLEKIMSNMVFIQDDISEIIEKLLLDNRYETPLLWVSNIFNIYFLKQFPNIQKAFSVVSRLVKNKEPVFPEMEIYIMQDERAGIKRPEEINKKRKNLSIHTKNFKIVSQFLTKGNTLEVVNMPKWIKEDNGSSKLFNGTYMLFADIYNLKKNYHTIFFHILLGHGEGKEALYKAFLFSLKYTKNIVVLEHNANSKDFKNSNIGVTRKELEDLLGFKPTQVAYCPGARSKNRNILFFYESIGDNSERTEDFT